MAPRWGYLVLGGILLIVGGSVAADHLLPPDSRDRAVWGTVQFLFGLAGWFGAEMWAMSFLTRERDRGDPLGLKDLVLPDRLWGQTFRRLPETSNQICAGFWSLCLLLTGAFVVGGLTYWLPSKNEPGRGGKAIVGKINPRDARGSADQDEEGGEDPEMAEGDDAKADPNQKTTSCQVVGFRTQNGELYQLVVATAQGDELRYSGVVNVDYPVEQRAELRRRLMRLELANSIFSGLKLKARWVRPEVSCQVKHAGFDEEGLFKDPQLVRLPSVPGMSEARTRKTSQCLIAGYTLDGGELTGLVLGLVEDGRLSYAGVVRSGLTPAVKEELLERLASMKSAAPPFPGLDLHAHWVRPTLSCEVQYAGRDQDGTLRKARFRGLR
jgi:hypothetical protein